MTNARSAWIAAHPYLEPIAGFESIVASAAAVVRPPPLAPRWEAWAAARAEGVPLLGSEAAGLDLDGAAAVLPEVAARVASAGPPDGVARAARELDRALREPGRARRGLDWALGHGEEPPVDAAHPGLLRLLAWAVVRPLVASALAERPPYGGAEWGRGSCPTCGAPPALAQLVLGGAAARERRLACGCCGTRWAFRRLECPFCGEADPRRLGILEVEGERAVRVDHCTACDGYVKTYTGEGDEELFLADWPTLHVDLAARRRGLRRAGASLYELPEHDGSEP